MPECLDDFIDESNPVRVIDVFVDALDLAEMNFEGVEPAATGRPSYHPSVLLKLYIYGYLNRVQSSRRLEREAGRNVEVMWLLGRLAPDHKTIADFRKDNGLALRKVCARFVELCREMGLLATASVAIDGSKFKAVNNRDKNFTRAKVERRRAQLLTNWEIGEPVYDVHLLSETGGSIRSSAGISVATEPFDDRNFDTLMVGGSVVAGALTPGVIKFLRQGVERSRRVASTCTGAFVLAEAGLLDGRRATTHWHRARELQARFPKVKVEEDRIFIVDGPVWTSAGMTAGIDLALAMIEQDLGADVARAVARQLVVYHRRAGGQSQFSALLELEPKSDRIQSALAYAKRNLASPLTVKQLDNAAHPSPRQFSRAFRAETGQSPAKAVENLRVETARLMMEQSRHSIDVIARQTGFADRYRMRRAFLRAFGQPPQVIRRNARAELAA